MTNPVALAQLAEAAFNTIAKLASVGEDQASAALAAIRAVVLTLRAGFDGKLEPQEVLTQIETLQSQVATNDAEALAELRKRFP